MIYYYDTTVSKVEETSKGRLYHLSIELGSRRFVHKFSENLLMQMLIPNDHNIQESSVLSLMTREKLKIPFNTTQIAAVYKAGPFYEKS